MAAAPTVTQPTLALPRGGGSLRGLGASFGAGSFRGAGTFSVPLPITPARDLSPGLELVYASGAGNGPLGLGMGVNLSRIARRTNVGVPRYTDADTFELSGAGTLTILRTDGPRGWQPVARTELVDGTAFRVRAFRPRLEGELPRIEQWERAADGVTHWVVTTAENVTSHYGISEDGRVADPGDPSRIAQWLIEETVDAKGNRIKYDYKREDGAGVPARISEEHRVRTAQRYPSRISYGNYVPVADTEEGFALELVFDYGERDLEDLEAPSADPYTPVRPWRERADPFSSYIHGFEVRTSRLCRAALMFHRFPDELGVQPCLTGALSFDYVESPALSRMVRVTRGGHRRRADGSYESVRLAPLDISWSTWNPPPAPRFAPLEVPDAAPPPGYLNRGDYQPVDLYGEGLPGILYSDGITTLYYEPQGSGEYTAPAAPAAFPNLRDLRDPRLSLEDLDGDGTLDLVLTTPGDAGYFPHRHDGDWGSFTPFARTPTQLMQSRAELVDLDGNGRSDLMVVRTRSVVAYPSEGRAGFSAGRLSERPSGFPAADPDSAVQLVTFAGVFGDGLAHRVRVGDGEVEVWPSLGRGRFARPVRLADAPTFAPGTQPDRIFFADIDGSGTADLVFAYGDRLEIHPNEAGNGFAPAVTVPLPVELSVLGRISFADVLGSGSTAILVSAGAPELRHWFCDLSGGAKPYLVTGLADNVGTTTQVNYVPSTRFYLEDKRAGRPWSLRLPFPVQVVEKVTTADEVAGTRVARSFRYRDGWFDPAEREFMGFGFVESRDAETFEELAAAAAQPAAPLTAPRPDRHAPPVLTRSWYHVGGLTRAPALAAARRREQFGGDPDAYVMPASVLDPAARAIGGRTLREAYAVLDGRPLRVELFAADGSPEQEVPFTVTDTNYTVEMVQPAVGGDYGCFHVSARETMTADYERDARDPRVTHALGLELTLFGDGDTYLERTCTILYPRRNGPPGPGRVPEQGQLLATVEESQHLRVLEPSRLVGPTFEQRTLEIGQITAAPGTYLAFDVVRALVDAALAAPIPYGTHFSGSAPQSRAARQERTLFWNDGQTGALPLGQSGPRALVHHAERAAFSSTWLAAVYGERMSEDDLRSAGYRFDEPGALWWNPGLISRYHGPDDPAAFFQVLETLSPAALGGSGPFRRSRVGYDTPYALRIVLSERYVDPQTALVSVGEIDYQALLPWQLTDPNGIVRQTLLDPLDAVIAASVFKPAMGDAPRVGDGDLRDYLRRPDTTFEAVVAEPLNFLQDAGAFFYADLNAWSARNRRPLTTVELQRPRYLSAGPVDADELAVSITYWDATGRQAARLTACDPAEDGLGGNACWIVSGRTVYDNKNRPVEEYLPRFATTPQLGPWEPGGPPAPAGELPPQITGYDPLGRAVRVETPKGLFSKLEYTPWEERRYDLDDTVLDSRYYNDFVVHEPVDPDADWLAEREALRKAAAAYNTPSVAVLDTAARPVRSVHDNLGAVAPNSFEAIVRGTPVTSAQLYEQLVAQGYLATRAMSPAGTWLGNRFDPYARGFAMTLDPPFEQFATAATELLLQGRLSDLREFDPEGRPVRLVDARLFLAGQRAGSTTSNVRCAYAMGASQPVQTLSADAGGTLALLDIFGEPVLSWDALGRSWRRTFDGLSRPCTLIVTREGTSSLRERITYGEHQPDAARHNLLGQPYLMEDEAGIICTPDYAIDGHASTTIRQFAADPRSEPDWSVEVPLSAETYTTLDLHDVFGSPVAQTTPDGSRTRWRYYRSGRLAAVALDPPGGAVEVTVADTIAYDPAGARKTVRFGNGAVQSSTYEATTQRLVAMRTTGPDSKTLQDVRYTFDPVGNLTLARDATARCAFCSPEPAARGDYDHDPLYRLVRATGLQLPGLEGTTYATGFKQTVFAQLCPVQELPTPQLEPFTEIYGYDLAGNLIRLEHAAASASYRREMDVLPDCNRLDGVPYDAAGGALQIELDGPLNLSWNDRGALAAAAPTAGGPRTFMTYDAGQARARKIVEDGATVSERRYLGACIVELRTSAGNTTTSTTLRVGDGAGTVVVLSDAPRLRWELDDRLGSVVVQLDETAAIVGYEAHLPYGGSAAIAGPSEAALASKTYRFSGKECDDSTALYYYGARYAATWLGRWLSPDPAGPADGLNLYAFVSGNPLTIVDRDGRCGDEPESPRYHATFRQYALKSIVYAPLQFALGIFAVVRLPLMSQIPGLAEFHRAWRQERRHVTREALTYLGVYPFVPSPVQRHFEQDALPYAMRSYGSLGSPAQLYLQNSFRRDQFAAAYAGGWLGQWLTVSTAVNWVTLRLLAPTRTWTAYGGRWAAIAALTWGVMRAGREEIARRDFAATRRRVAEGSAYDQAAAAGLGSLTGLPINLSYFAAEGRRALQFTGTTATAFGAIALGLLSLHPRIAQIVYGRGWQNTVRSTALVRYQERQWTLAVYRDPKAKVEVKNSNQN
jgi:RHS repeat-associated protein